VTRRILLGLLPGLLLIAVFDAPAAEKFTTIYSARVMAQALPWIAEEAVEKSGFFDQLWAKR